MKFNTYRQAKSVRGNNDFLAENREQVERSVNCVSGQINNALVIKEGSVCYCKDILSTMDATTSEFVLDGSSKPETQTQQMMMRSIETIEVSVTGHPRMDSILDMSQMLYLSAKRYDIGSYLLYLSLVDSVRPVIVLGTERFPLGLYCYIGTPFDGGEAYLFAQDNDTSFFAMLQELHFFSLREVPGKPFLEGRFLSFNPEWGWKNISYGPILKENQGLVQSLVSGLRTPNVTTARPGLAIRGAANLTTSAPGYSDGTCKSFLGS